MAEIEPSAPQDEAVLRLQLENAKLKFEAESKSLFERHEAALRHIKFYKWIAGALFAFILGGSIYSFVKVDEYIDNRIAQRVVKTDRISLMLNKAQFGQWHEALGLVDEIRAEMDSGKLGADLEFKKFIYMNELWLLSQSYEKTANGWIGQDQYDDLMKNQEFRRELFVKQSFHDDGDLMSMLGMCLLKFGKGPESLAQGKDYLQQSILRLQPVQRRAGIHWALAMLDLVEGHQESALQHLKAAEDLHPTDYLIKDLVPYKNSFLRSEEFILWNDLAARTTKTNFSQTYEKFIAGI
jgi:hypothetical protein